MTRSITLIAVFLAMLLAGGCASALGDAAESLSGRVLWGYCQQAGQGTRCDVRRGVILDARQRCERDGGSREKCRELSIVTTCPDDDPSRACPDVE